MRPLSDSPINGDNAKSKKRDTEAFFDQFTSEQNSAGVSNSSWGWGDEASRGERSQDISNQPEAKVPQGVVAHRKVVALKSRGEAHKHRKPKLAGLLQCASRVKELRPNNCVDKGNINRNNDIQSASTAIFLSQAPKKGVFDQSGQGEEGNQINARVTELPSQPLTPGAGEGEIGCDDNGWGDW